MDEKKAKMQQALMKGLTKAQAKKLTDVFFDIFESSEKQVVVSPEEEKRAKLENQLARLSTQDSQLADTLGVHIKRYIKGTGYNYKLPEKVELANAISQLHRINGKPYEEIAALITYLYTKYAPNSSFDWRMQVRSGVAFRRHYEKIMASANQDFNFVKSRQIEDVK